jgi:hypothetical protein
MRTSHYSPIALWTGRPAPGARTALVAVAAVMVLAAGCGARSARQSPGSSPMDEPTSTAPSLDPAALPSDVVEGCLTGSGDTPDYSIGDIIDQSDLVVVGRVAAIDAPRWNSPDGRDWRAEFEADPDPYRTVPFVLTRVDVEVEQFVGPEAEGSADDRLPTVSLGEVLGVEFLGCPVLELSPVSPPPEPGAFLRARYLEVGSRHLFFLDWGFFPTPRGAERRDWRGEQHRATWGVDGDGLVFPTDLTHQGSLEAGDRAGDVEVVESDVGASATSVDDMARIVELERASPGRATLASYSRWSVG